MIKHSVALVFYCAVFSFISSASGQVMETGGREGLTVWLPQHSAPAPSSTCLGAGYIPYSYPALETCPCGNDGCFHPWRYYAGGKCYRRNWFNKWLRAHLGRGSMLEDYPCPCVFPTNAAPAAMPVDPGASSIWPIAPVSIESTPAEW